MGHSPLQPLASSEAVRADMILDGLALISAHKEQDAAAFRCLSESIKPETLLESVLDAAAIIGFLTAGDSNRTPISKVRASILKLQSTGKPAV